jgi:hypothetical protein
VPVSLYISDLQFPNFHIHTLHSEWIGLLLSIMFVYYSMNDIQAVFFQTAKNHTSFLFYQSWRFGLHFFLGHVTILKLRTEVLWWGFRRLFPSSNPPPPVLQNSKFYSVSRGCQNGEKCKKVPWTGRHISRSEIWWGKLHVTFVCGLSVAGWQNLVSKDQIQPN